MSSASPGGGLLATAPPGPEASGTLVGDRETDSRGARLFEFEADLATSLRRFPIAVRHKLDQCGVHLGLEDWQLLPLEARRALHSDPVTGAAGRAAFITFLEALAARYWAGRPIERIVPEPAPAWRDLARVPADLATLLAEEFAGFVLDEKRWAALDDLQRFALEKLSRSGHRNRGFEALAREVLGLVEDQVRAPSSSAGSGCLEADA